MKNHSRILPVTGEDDFAFATNGDRQKSTGFNPEHDYGVRYILKGKEWYVRNKDDEWIPLGLGAVHGFLISAGLDPEKGKDEDMSEVNEAIHHVEMKVLCDFIGLFVQIGRGNCSYFGLVSGDWSEKHLYQNLIKNSFFVFSGRSLKLVEQWK